MLKSVRNNFSCTTIVRLSARTVIDISRERENYLKIADRLTIRGILAVHGKIP